MSDDGSTYDLPREYWGSTMSGRAAGASLGRKLRYQGDLQRCAEARGLHWEVAASKVYHVPRGTLWPDLRDALDAVIADTPLPGL